MQDKIKQCFDAIVSAATAQPPKRCPIGSSVFRSDLVHELVRSGDLKVEVYHHNYRRITILTGPHAGKSTADDPHGRKSWKTFTKDGITVREGVPTKPTSGVDRRVHETLRRVAGE